MFDAYSKAGLADPRSHVAVDRITGGANDGFLFTNTVVTSSGTPTFEVELWLDEPTADEVRWLALALRAIDRGLVRVGSSKAGGRLALAQPPEVSGPHAEILSKICAEVSRG